MINCKSVQNKKQTKMSQDVPTFPLTKGATERDY